MNKRADLANMVGISQAESQSQRVETRLIEPRSFSQGSATFELPREGILSSDVALQIQLTTAQTNANERMDLPLMAGILGCIDRAELFFGTTLISSVEELPHLMQLKNLFVDQNIRDQQHNVYLGSFSGLKTVNGGASGGTTVGIGQFALNSLNTVPAGGTEASTGVIGLVETAANQCNKLQHFRTTASANTTPFFCIKLKEIFPVLSQIPLPLFALKERIRFVFHFNQDTVGNRAVSVKTDAQSVPALPFIIGNNIVQASLKLSTDLIYYEDIAGVPSPMMRIQEELEKGANLVMSDYVSIFNVMPIGGVAGGGVPAGTVAVSTVSTLLGLDHQIVRNILISTPQQPDNSSAVVAGGAPANRILGNFCSQGSNDQTVLQVSINNENIFPSALNTTAKLYNELSQVHDKPLKINRGLYSSNGQVDTSVATGGGRPVIRSDAAFNVNQTTFGNPNDVLNFSLNYLGVNLSKDAGQNYVGNGIQVGRQPVIVTIQRDRVADDGKQLRVLFWAECERMMMIKNGNIFMSGQ